MAEIDPFAAFMGPFVVASSLFDPFATFMAELGLFIVIKIKKTKKNPKTR